MTGVRLLLVDDERGFAEAMARRLGRRGLEVRLAESGEQPWPPWRPGRREWWCWI